MHEYGERERERERVGMQLEARWNCVHVTPSNYLLIRGVIAVALLCTRAFSEPERTYREEANKSIR